MAGLTPFQTATPQIQPYELVTGADFQSGADAARNLAAYYSRFLFGVDHFLPPLNPLRTIPQLSQTSTTLGVSVVGQYLFLQGRHVDAVSTPVNLAIANANATNPRIDLVCVQYSQLTQATGTQRPFLEPDNTLPNLPTNNILESGAFQVVTGTPNASPVAPAVPAGYVALAAINVVANATAIVGTNITPLLPTAEQVQGILTGSFTSTYHPSAINFKTQPGGAFTIIGANHVDVDTVSFPLTVKAGSGAQSIGGCIFAGKVSLGGVLQADTGAAPPSAPTVSAVAGGSLANQGTLGAKVSYIYNAGGETFASGESTVAVAANNLLRVNSPGAQTGAASYNVYAGVLGGPWYIQNTTPITLGTNWTEATTGLIGSGTQAPQSLSTQKPMDWTVSILDNGTAQTLSFQSYAGELNSNVLLSQGPWFAPGLAAMFNQIVAPVQSADLKVSPSSNVQVVQGSTLQFTAQYVDVNAGQPSGTTYAWSTTLGSIGASTGLLNSTGATIGAVGVVTVTATPASGAAITKTVPFTVAPPYVARISPAAVSTDNSGNTAIQVTGSLQDQNGNPVTGALFTWSQTTAGSQNSTLSSTSGPTINVTGIKGAIVGTYAGAIILTATTPTGVIFQATANLVIAQATSSSQNGSFIVPGMPVQDWNVGSSGPAPGAPPGLIITAAGGGTGISGTNPNFPYQQQLQMTAPTGHFTISLSALVNFSDPAAYTSAFGITVSYQNAGTWVQIAQQIGSGSSQTSVVLPAGTYTLLVQLVPVIGSNFVQPGTGSLSGTFTIQPS